MISNVVFAVSNLTHSWSPAYKWAAVSPGSRLAFSCFKKNSTSAENEWGGFFSGSGWASERTWEMKTLWLVSIHLLLDGCSSQRAVTWEVRAFGGGWQAERGQRQSDGQNTRRPGAAFDWSRGSLFSEWRAWMTQCVMNDSIFVHLFF